MSVGEGVLFNYLLKLDFVMLRTQINFQGDNKDMMRQIVRAVSIAALGLMVLTAGCGNGDQVKKEAPVKPIKIIDISFSGTSRVLKFSGTISPLQDVNMAFEVPGKLVQFPVSEGQVVEKGELMARLDDRDYKIAYDSRRAVYATAKKDLERADALLKKEIISGKQYDDTKRNYEVAEADMKAAKKRLDDAALIAPFKGRVAKKLMDNYQNVQAKQTVLVFQDDSMLKMVVNVPERDFVGKSNDEDLDKLSEVLKPKVSISSLPDRFFPAFLHEVSTTADPATRTFEVTLRFAPPTDINVLPGMTARLTVNLPQKGGDTLIPANAVFAESDGKSCVWIINPETMQAAKREVEVGTMQGSSIVIRSGLNDGDMVAASGIHHMREGMKVSRYTK